MSPAVRVFINYRRRDTRHVAGRLRDQIVARFGEESVFVDVESILPGQDYVSAIDSAVSHCDFLLVLIGEEWLAADDNGLRRIDDPNDRLRLEIESGLRHRTQVIPVLVDAARMPRSKELPESLVPLSRHQAVHLRHDSFPGDVRYLLDALDPGTSVLPPVPPEPGAASRPSDRAPQTARWLSVLLLVAALVAMVILLAGVRESVQEGRRMPHGAWDALVWFLPALPAVAAIFQMTGRGGRGVALGYVLGAVTWVWITGGFSVNKGFSAGPHLVVGLLLLAAAVAVVAASPELRAPVTGNAAGPAFAALLLLVISVLGRGGAKPLAAAVTAQPSPHVLALGGFLPAVLIPVLLAGPAVVLRLRHAQAQALLVAAWLQVVYTLVVRAVLALAVDSHPVNFAVDATIFLAASFFLVLAVRAGEQPALRAVQVGAA